MGAPNGRTSQHVTPPPATGRQREYLQQLAARIPGLDQSALAAFSLQCCGKALAELDRREASQLIDALRQLAAEHSKICEMLPDAGCHDADAWRISREYEPENGHASAHGAPDTAPAR